MAGFATGSRSKPPSPVWQRAALRPGWRIIRRALKRPSLHRDALLLAASTVVGSLCGFLYWKLVTLAYAATSVGVASATLTSANFMGGLATLGLTTGIVRFLPQASSPIKAALSTFAHLASALTGVVAVAVFVGGRQWWAPDFAPAQGTTLYVAAFLALVLSTAHLNVHFAALQAARQIPWILTVNTGVSLAQVALILALPVSLGPLSIVAAALLPRAGASILLFRVTAPTKGSVSPLRCTPGCLRKDLAQRAGDLALRVRELIRQRWDGFKAAPLGAMTRYSLGAYLFNLLWNLPAFLFPLLALNYLGPAANAHLAVAWLLSSFMLVIPNSVAVALLIDGSHREAEVGRGARTALLIDLALLVPLGLALAALAPVILRAFGADYARAASGLLRLLALASWPTAINSVYLTIQRVRKQIVRLNLLACALASLGIVCSLALVPRLGLSGIGCGWLLSQSLVALLLVGPLLREGHQTEHQTGGG